eukprot:TRINITY_DN1139_c0_g2_i7.p1 TRINITY_DN1139_c0_g2~~TRINITY_DN1139_c0_g2_i7.p1  ORF type:complete len:129 (-),score=27.92 TRINITY_DN1139_c0_g2_i7:119-505(-)
MYSAPEQQLGPHDIKVDVFPFGTILFELVEGVNMSSHFGFGSLDDISNTKKDLWNKARQCQVFTAGKWTRGLLAIVEKCWKLVPSARPSFDQIKAALEEERVAAVVLLDRAKQLQLQQQRPPPALTQQ